MGAIASQITSRTIIYSTIYSDADQRKQQSSASLTGEFPAQMASNAENDPIWWRHHVDIKYHGVIKWPPPSKSRHGHEITKASEVNFISIFSSPYLKKYLRETWNKINSRQEAWLYI